MTHLTSQAKEELRDILAKEIPSDNPLLHNDEMLEEIGVVLLGLTAISLKERLRKKIGQDPPKSYTDNTPDQER